MVPPPNGQQRQRVATILILACAGSTYTMLEVRDRRHPAQEQQEANKSTTENREEVSALALPLQPENIIVAANGNVTRR